MEQGRMCSNIGSDVTLDHESVLWALASADERVVARWKWNGVLEAQRFLITQRLKADYEGEKSKPVYKSLVDDHKGDLAYIKWAVHGNPDKQTLTIRCDSPCHEEAEIEFVRNPLIWKRNQQFRSEKEVTEAVCQVIVDRTIESIRSTVAESRFTDREFLSYHLGHSYSQKQVAELLEYLLGTSLSVGSVSKYRGRARKKFREAQRTQALFVSESNDHFSEPKLGPAANESPLEDSDKAELAQNVRKAVDETPWDEMGPEISLKFADGNITISMIPQFEGKLGVKVYVEPDALPDDCTITVDVAYENTESNLPIKTDGELTKLSECGETMKALSSDLYEVLRAVLPELDRSFESRFFGREPKLEAIEAMPGTVVFSESALVVPEEGLP